MEERRNTHSSAQALAEKLRRNPHTAGVWQLLDLEETGAELVICQREDQSAELVIFKPTGGIKILEGSIISRRLQTGHPIRQELFVSKNGEKEVSIRTAEF